MILGLALLGLNLVGLGLSLRSPQLAKSNDYFFQNDVRLVYSETISAVQGIEAQPNSEALKQLVTLISGTVAHYWPTEQATTYNLHVPATENFVLWTVGVASPFLESLTGKPFKAVYQGYEFHDWQKGLERGVGLCSQHAIILDSILAEKGFKAEIVRLDGHVLNQVWVEDAQQYWLVDSDYGLTMPYSLAEVQESPEIVRAHYFNVLQSPDILNLLVELYGAEGNELISSSRAYLGPGYVLFEDLSYLAKWILPLLSCLAGAWLVRRRRSMPQ